MNSQVKDWRVNGIGWLLAIVMLWLAWRGAHRHAGVTPTDLGTWQGDWHALVSCVGTMEPGQPCKVSKFPLAYLVNSGLYGLLADRGRQVISIANGISLTLPLFLLWFYEGGAALRRAGWPYVLAIALSPLPMFYIATGALEVQAGVFCGVYIGAFARSLASPDLSPGRRTLWVLGASGLVFPLFKDTVAPLIGVALALTLAWHGKRLLTMAQGPEGRRSLLKFGVVATVPVVVAQLADLAYCWFKYGVPLPLAYMNEASQAGPSYAKSAEFLAGSLLSPNGGILIFWGLAGFVAFAGWRLAGLVPRRTVLITAICVVVVSCLALSRWWAPFGWDGWGDRLMVSAVVAALAAIPASLRLRYSDSGRALRPSVCFAYLPLLACSVYYVGLPYFLPPWQAMRDSLWSGPACSAMRELLPTVAVAQGMPFWKGDAYYACARERMLFVPRPDSITSGTFDAHQRSLGETHTCTPIDGQPGEFKCMLKVPQ